MNRPETIPKIAKICVYCGSGAGTDPAFVEAATALGIAMAKAGIGLVYGGGDAGMMGAVADAVRSNGGTITGIIPQFLLNKERAGFNGEGLIVTADMHERKRKMFEMADAFVAMPGGVGTLEELVEQLTWAQLGRHKKPILIANIKGFWQPLCALLDHMKALEFIRPGLEFDMLVADRVEDILPMLQKAAESVPDSAKVIPAAVADKL
ncbi:MAG: TIGR00730 family Rossman fold protein [Hyphomicrobiales bacterium]|nr:TIGR00730 family Rossman fold protein [Hyphomicrobiales bacterium]